MGIGYAWRNLIHGRFQDAFNGLLVSDDALAATDQAGSALDATIARQQSEGLIDAETANRLYGQMSPNTDSDQYWSGSGETPWGTFQQTLTDEANSIGQWGSGAINRTLGLGFRIIPWQVKVGLFIVLLIWLYPIWKPFAARLFKR